MFCQVFTRKCYIKLKKIAKSKPSSLFCHAISDNEKSFVILTPVVNILKQFSLSLTLQQISWSVCPWQAFAD
jgi:hypothetical protein